MCVFLNQLKLLIYIQLIDQIKSELLHCLNFTYLVQDQDQATDE